MAYRPSSQKGSLHLVAALALTGAFSGCGDETEPPTHSPGAATFGVGVDGGTVDRLAFAVVGDTRPAVMDDNDGYPTETVRTIYRDLEGLDPPVPFAIATGDYVFASPRNDFARIQLDAYLGARKSFSGLLFPALGNHECTGATKSNCGLDGASGLTSNYTIFIEKMLGPIHKKLPYYVIDLTASNGAWTAKLVFVAANAWSGDQAEWLSATMSRPTTYTFVVRHEPKDATTAPGVLPSEEIMSRFPYTLAIVGHTHTYGRSGPREVIVGNGGAPLSSAKSYGFGLVERRDDGAIQVDMRDYQSQKPDLEFRFAVNADGSPAPVSP